MVLMAAALATCAFAALHGAAAGKLRPMTLHCFRTFSIVDLHFHERNGFWARHGDRGGRRGCRRRRRCFRVVYPYAAGCNY
jgi:hypothetical protein